MRHTDFGPIDPMFDRSTHEILLCGKPRDDYRIEVHGGCITVTFDNLSYEEQTNVEIRRRRG